MTLFNIFKKSERKKSSKEEKPRIIADIHEKNSLVIANIVEKNILVDFQSLKVGDFAIGNILIERKSFSDFISSMISKRLIDQLKQLKQSKNPVLILEKYKELENLSEKESKLNPNSIRGFILSIIHDWQIPIIFTKDEEETASYLILLAKRQLKSPSEISLHSRIPKTKNEQKQYILESFPNIGPKTAKKLIERFSSIKNTINASEQELEEILKSKTKYFKEITDY
mgnify:CR=1 FL=1